MHCSRYVKTMLDSFNSNPTANWKSKDAAMYLVTSLATRAKTAKHGITQTNQLVNLSEFCAAHVAPELHNLSNMAQFPILKVFTSFHCSALQKERLP